MGGQASKSVIEVLANILEIKIDLAQLDHIAKKVLSDDIPKATWQDTALPLISRIILIRDSIANPLMWPSLIIE